MQGSWVAVFGGQQATLTLAERSYNMTYGFESHAGGIGTLGDQIIFLQSNTCSGTGTYTWSVGANSLTFNVVGRDACEGRSTALNNRTYTRSS